MILKEYSKLILNESSKLVLTEAENLTLQDGTQIVNKVPFLIKNFTKQAADITQTLEEFTPILKTVYNIQHQIKQPFLNLKTNEKLVKWQEYYLNLQKVLEEVLSKSSSKKIINLKNSAEFTQLNIKISTILQSIHKLNTNFSAVEWDKFYTLFLEINKLIKQTNIEEFFNLILTLQKKKWIKEFTQLTTDITDACEKYEQYLKKSQVLISEEEFNLYKNCEQNLNNINTLIQDLTNITDFTQLSTDCDQLKEEAKKALKKLIELNTSLELEQTKQIKDWDLEIKKAAIKGTKALQKVQKEYYEIEWGDKAELLNSIISAFSQETETYGYTATKNPFIAYLKTIFNNEAICKAFKTAKAVNYDLLHNACVNTNITLSDLRGTGEFKENNIIFSPYFYKIDTAECQEYLNLHKYTCELLKKNFKQELLTQKYSADKVAYYIDLFYQNGNTIMLSDDRIAGHITNPFKSIAQIRRELAVAFSESALLELETAESQQQEEKKTIVTEKNYSTIIDKIKEDYDISLDDRKKLAAALIDNNVKLPGKDCTTLLQQTNLTDINDNLTNLEKDEIINDFDYNFTNVLNWSLDKISTFVSKLIAT